MLNEEPYVHLNEYCDVCPAWATTRFEREEQDLVFCDHHTHTYEETLVEQGWSRVVETPEETIDSEEEPVVESNDDEPETGKEPVLT